MKKYPLVIMIAFLLFLLAPTKVHPQKKKILIIDSYHSSYPWTSACIKGLNEYIAPEYDKIYFDMDTKRIPQDQFKTKAKQCMDIFHKEKPDLVITMDDNALKYSGQRISATGTPVVFMGINQNPRIYFAKNKLPHNVTGILERPLLKRSLLVLSKIYGSANFLLMMDNGMTSQAIIETSLQGTDRINYNSCEMDLFTTDNFNDWKKKVLNLNTNKYKGIIICNYAAMRDESGQHAAMNTVSTWTSAHSKVPVYALWEYSLGKGKAVGGLVMSGYYQGKAAAEMANTILATGRIPPVQIPSQGVLTFSKHELSRWGILLPHELSSRAKFVE
ncbi:ABC transporter substrate-binding protein [Maridesulfovibrio sp. FT414]|uniref:ABC transporter substrate-binding protein n=1 Tax=Maridesulfovibrio sp. FT414 TaxID=2979469 RepID=UPI003D800335